MSCRGGDCSWPCSPQAWGESGQQTGGLAGIVCWPRPGCRAHPTCSPLGAMSGHRLLLARVVGRRYRVRVTSCSFRHEPPIYLKACGGREAVTCERPGLSRFSRKAFALTASASCSALSDCDPPKGSPPGSSVHGILRARILEWVAIPFSRGFSRRRDGTRVSRIASKFFPI